ncbi:hypothetical protein HAP48_0026430 [Bradyrhizobium septentrionale]|uniref:Uncharacterized protein n=1 Tax=Bradyrhizobium septentrionale TaxID=1404411 RepID=A0A974A0R7_9BRAD|nr:MULTISPECIES: hypothetical protein [Bradyrhizobium]MCK7672533.1 hypothetical protein [Bradyrhizobium sp. 2S1]UGY12261.1 hypothetical protein HAP48_0026430 [Bradyrhizobium septentrionale]UGY25621.1 hypothetical protein HU675_0001685 [Bradyrhizobium septentrionale]
MYKMFKGGNPAEGKIQFTMDEYLHHTHMLTASVKQFVSILRRVWADQGLCESLAAINREGLQV